MYSSWWNLLLRNQYWSIQNFLSLQFHLLKWIQWAKQSSMVLWYTYMWYAVYEKLLKWRQQNLKNWEMPLVLILSKILLPINHQEYLSSLPPWYSFNNTYLYINALLSIMNKSMYFYICQWTVSESGNKRFLIFCDYHFLTFHSLPKVQSDMWITWLLQWNTSNRQLDLKVNKWRQKKKIGSHSQNMYLNNLYSVELVTNITQCLALL